MLELAGLSPAQFVAEVRGRARRLAVALRRPLLPVHAVPEAGL